MPDSRDPVKALREAVRINQCDGLDEVTLTIDDARALLRQIECMEQCRSCTNPVCDGCRYDWRAAKEGR